MAVNDGFLPYSDIRAHEMAEPFQAQAVASPWSAFETNRPFQRVLLQQLLWLDTQLFCKLRDDLDSGIADTSFDTANIGPVQADFGCELFLRPALLLTQLAHVASYFPADVHADMGQMHRPIVYRL